MTNNDQERKRCVHDPVVTKACGDLDQRFGVTVANDSAICCSIKPNNKALEVSLVETKDLGIIGR